jgi:hypothetical protein
MFYPTNGAPSRPRPDPRHVTVGVKLVLCCPPLGLGSVGNPLRVKVADRTHHEVSASATSPYLGHVTFHSFFRSALSRLRISGPTVLIMSVPLRVGRAAGGRCSEFSSLTPGHAAVHPASWGTRWHAVRVLPRVRLVVATLTLGGVAAGCIGFLKDDPWPARVTRMDETTVCTEQLEPGDHPGGERPCLSGDEVLVLFEHLQVGDCVELDIHHPTLVLKDIIPCPDQ